MPTESHTAVKEVAAFVERIDEVYGLYLDATVGFKANAQQVRGAQEQSRNVVEPGTDLDSLPMFVGRGDPTDPASVLLHMTTQGQFKRRNDDDGDNHVRLAHWVVVLLFEYWETEHRASIADALGIATGDLRVPIFGDLRRLRHVVIHHNGVVDDKCAHKMEVISGLKARERLVLSASDVESLVRSVKAALDGLVQERVGLDPAHRIVRRLV